MVINCDVPVMMLFSHFPFIHFCFVLSHLRPGSGRQRKRTPGAGVVARRAMRRGWDDGGHDGGHGGRGASGASSSSSWRLWMSKLFQT